jgi:amino acid transporter
MKKHLPKIIVGVLIGTFLIGIGIALADMPDLPKPDLLPGPDETKTQLEVQEYFRNEAIPTFISGFLGLISGLALLSLIYSGIRFLTSFGEEEKITEAKRVATWSILGFLIALLSYAIVATVNTLVYPEGDYATEDQQQVIYDDI